MSQLPPSVKPLPGLGECFDKISGLMPDLVHALIKSYLKPGHGHTVCKINYRVTKWTTTSPDTDNGPKLGPNLLADNATTTPLQAITIDLKSFKLVEKRKGLLQKELECHCRHRRLNQLQRIDITTVPPEVKHTNEGCDDMMGSRGREFIFKIRFSEEEVLCRCNKKTLKKYEVSCE